MLSLNVAEQEFFDPDKEIFFESRAMKVQLEHSLISMSKWESIWCKPFLPVKNKEKGIETHEQELSYISCMIIGRVEPWLPGVLYRDHGKEIREYIAHPNTATTIYDAGSKSGTSTSIITTEVIYYWMVRFSIPNEYEKWHINRLLTLINICNLKEKEAAGKNKMTPADAARHQYLMNKARRGG
jgi:hypothetical protein